MHVTTSMCQPCTGEIELAYQDQNFVSCTLSAFGALFVHVFLLFCQFLDYCHIFLSLVMYLHCWQPTQYGQGQHTCVASECVAKCTIVATLMHGAWR